MTVALADLVFRHNEQDPIRVPKLNALVGYVQAATEVTTDPAITALAALDPFAVGDLIYASGAEALSKLADVAAGNVLLSGGVGVAPAWGKVGLTTHVTGDLPFANLTQGSARSVLAVAGNATADFASVQGAASQFLGINAAGDALAFQTMAGDATLSGPTLAIANDAVTYAKMQDVSATDKLLGRSSSGAGNVEEIACTAAGRALLDDADAAAQRTTLGLGTAAVKNTGTSGDAIPLLDGNNTYSGTATFTGGLHSTGFSFASGKALNIGISSSLANLTSYDFPSGYIGCIFDALYHRFDVSGAAKLKLDSTFGNYADDAAASAGGVPVGSIYRNGSALMVRVA